ncbi:hypothetical protein [Infirmifilum sp. SLHALR2]|nr:MAG: hypothetical protein B7L53_00040 [Thermofilum sp. NZ13]
MLVGIETRKLASGEDGKKHYPGSQLISKIFNMLKGFCPTWKYLIYLIILLGFIFGFISLAINISFSTISLNAFVPIFKLLMLYIPVFVLLLFGIIYPFLIYHHINSIIKLSEIRWLMLSILVILVILLLICVIIYPRFLQPPLDSISIETLIFALIWVIAIISPCIPLIILTWNTQGISCLIKGLQLTDARALFLEFSYKLSLASNGVLILIGFFIVIINNLKYFESLSSKISVDPSNLVIAIFTVVQYFVLRETRRISRAYPTITILRAVYSLSGIALEAFLTNPSNHTYIVDGGPYIASCEERGNVFVSTSGKNLPVIITPGKNLKVLLVLENINPSKHSERFPVAITLHYKRQSEEGERSKSTTILCQVDAKSGEVKVTHHLPYSLQSL